MTKKGNGIHGKHMSRRNLLKTAGVSVVASVLALSSVPLSRAASMDRTSTGSSPAYDGLFPQHAPMGTGVGAMPGRVVWAFDPGCVNWTSGYWWKTDNFDYSRIKSMVDGGIAALAGKNTAREGWNVLFRYHNGTRGKGHTAYAAGEKIAIKTNMNGAGWSGPNNERTANAFTNPVALRALLVSMVEEAGIAPQNITVFDASRNVPGWMVTYCSAGVLAGVNFRYSEAGSPNDCVQDKAAPVVWSQRFSGERCYLPTTVTEAEYCINFADLKGHSINGITLTAKNHFGTIMNSNRMASPVAANLHQFVTADSMGNYTVVVDLMAHFQLGAKTMLYMLDGIVVSPSEGGTTTVNSDNAKWQSAPFNGGYTASLFFSQDPVAIDSVGADFLGNEPTLQRYNSVIRNNPNVENYLHEAGGVTHAPSGTVYNDGRSNAVANLGVHEHWSNSTEKRYSRNRGETEGIELIQIGAQGEM